MQRVLQDDLDMDGNQIVLWQEQPFTGIGYDLRPDGKLWSEVPYVEGVQEGVGREWYPSGQLKEETSYQFGNSHGPQRAWREDGSLEREAEYEYAILVREKVWDEAGKLVREFVLDESNPKYDLLEKFRARYRQA